MAGQPVLASTPILNPNPTSVSPSSQNRAKPKFTKLPPREGVSKTLWIQLDYNSRKHVIESNSDNSEAEYVDVDVDQIEAPSLDEGAQDSELDEDDRQPKGEEEGNISS